MNLTREHKGNGLFAAIHFRGQRTIADRYAIALVIMLALSSGVRAQSVDPNVPVPGENNYPSAFREQVLVHTDQSWYVTGETLWYSVFLRDAQKGHLSMLSRVAYVELLDHSGKSTWQAMIRIDSGRGHGSWIIPNSLPTGGYILRSFTRWMRNQPAEQFFQVPLVIINPQKKPEAAIRGIFPKANAPGADPGNDAYGSETTLSVQTDQRRYSQRSPVTLRILARDANGKPVRSSLSVSVARLADSMETDTHQNDLPGPPPATPITRERDANTASHEISASTGRTDSVLTAHTAQQVHIPEISGPIITVLAQHKQSGRPVPGAWVCLSVPGKRFQTVIARTGADGRAAFPLGQQEGSGILAFTLLDRMQDSVLLTPEPLFDGRTGHQSWLPEIPASASVKLAASILDEVQLSQAFQQSSRGPMLIRPSTDTTAFYGKPDAEYLLDDYVRFTTMEEVLREFVREIEVRKSKADYKLRVLNAPMRSFFEDDPLVLLDGLPIRDMNVVLGIDPRKLRSIAIVSRRFYLGGQGFPGIITLRTYDGDMGGINLPSDILITEFSGLLPPYAFVAPDYTQHPGSRLPDLRRTLWWSPEVNISSAVPATLRFHTGDVPGRYQITIYACTAEGKLLHEQTYIDVQ